VSAGVSIQPVGLRAEDLPAYFGSSTVAAEIVKTGILIPVRKVKGLTIYDTGDCARAWIEWCKRERLKKPHSES